MDASTPKAAERRGGVVRMVSVYSVTHFLVDFACAFLIFRNAVGTPDLQRLLLLYNFCAFALQMPLGVLADKLNRNPLFAALGCVLVCAAYAAPQVPYAAVLLAGLGNGLFHVGGGVDILNVQKSGALGIFVSPGAFGVYFGTALGRGGAFPPVPLALLAAAALILAVRRTRGADYPNNAAFSLEAGVPAKMALTAAACLFAVVCLRSFIGLALNFSWKGHWHWGTVLVCAVVLGKTLGGLSLDRFGMAKTSVLSLGLAAPLFLFPQAPAAGAAALLLFNMTMPVTLWAMAKIFPGAKGFSFGLLTFGLFLGYLPAYMGVNIPQGAYPVFAAGAVLSLALLWAGLRKLKHGA